MDPILAFAKNSGALIDEALTTVAAALDNIQDSPNALRFVQQAAESLVLTLNRMSPNLIRHDTARQFVIKRFGQQLSAGKF